MISLTNLLECLLNDVNKGITLKTKQKCNDTLFIFFFGGFAKLYRLTLSILVGNMILSPMF